MDQWGGATIHIYVYIYTYTYICMKHRGFEVWALILRWCRMGVSGLQIRGLYQGPKMLRSAFGG